MKYITLLLAILCTGCTGLTHHKYVKVKGFGVNRSAEFASNPNPNHTTDEWWPNLGLNNKGIFSRNDVSVEFLSNPHYWKLKLEGIIIPLFPYWGKYPAPSHDGTKNIRIANISETGVISITGAEKSQHIRVCYENNGEPKIQLLSALIKNDPAALKLEPGSHIWLNFEDVPKGMTLRLNMNGENYELKLKEGSAWVWHLISV